MHPKLLINSLEKQEYPVEWEQISLFFAQYITLSNRMHRQKVS